MSGLKRIITGVADTSDRAAEPDFRTRRYRGQAKEAAECLKKLPSEDGAFRLVHVDAERGEIMIEFKNHFGFKHDVVVTVFSESPVRMAVDIHAATRGRMLDLGGNRELVRRIYRYLDRHLERTGDSG
ncbi:uncharacterized protein DUF1499 [Melghirimyces profundicolus]|uniref:Uncharacterized protein DUF1499 n=1 Tax=Melghirimyces profundicolus TaxID=1242148 RepID=A0A2T6C9E0_9BACL|nr:DUF1499 domain-containing protein [Melghirimyces profundicolus]PTX64935.1 uncharacterized protein DUF1499 [Melghirimyces profundicolus]